MPDFSFLAILAERFPFLANSSAGPQSPWAKNSLARARNFSADSTGIPLPAVSAIDSAAVVIPTTRDILKLTGAENVTLRGLTFECARFSIRAVQKLRG